MTTPTSKVLGHDSFKGMGVDFGDLNGDGVPDIFVEQHRRPSFALEESHFLWHEHGRSTPCAAASRPYVEPERGARAGAQRLGLGRKLADFDNDGVPRGAAGDRLRGAARTNRWPELHELAMGNDELLSDASRLAAASGPATTSAGTSPTRFFVARRGRPLRRRRARARARATTTVTRGIAIADVDGDGDLDFAIAQPVGAVRVLPQRVAARRPFLGLHVLLPADGAAGPGGTPAMRPAVGATVIVRTPDGRRFSSFVDGGNGHTGKRSPDVHFGVGAGRRGCGPRDDDRLARSAGRHEQTTTLMPGWHTVTLGRVATP